VTGFFGILRDGRFSEEGYRRVVEILTATDVGGVSLTKDFVAVTWYIPIFMSWQRDQCVELGMSAGEYDRRANHLHALVENLLGVP
jgi:hypothetical protein